MRNSEFHLEYTPERVSKIILQWELCKMVQGVEGSIVECGVFRGASLLRFAYYNKILGGDRTIIGFDVFGKFPEATYEPDKEDRYAFVATQGDGYDIDNVRQLILDRGGGWTYLIKGDVCKTVPEYVKWNDTLKIALLNIDTDLYEPAKVALENLYSKVATGGIIVSDNHLTFPGEAKAFSEFCMEHNLPMLKMELFNHYYIRK